MRSLVVFVAIFVVYLAVANASMLNLFYKVKMIRALCSLSDSELEDVRYRSHECMRNLDYTYMAETAKKYQRCGFDIVDLYYNPRKACGILDGKYDDNIHCFMEGAWNADNISLPIVTNNHKYGVLKFVQCLKPIVMDLIYAFNTREA